MNFGTEVKAIACISPLNRTKRAFGCCSDWALPAHLLSAWLSLNGAPSLTGCGFETVAQVPVRVREGDVLLQSISDLNNQDDKIKIGGFLSI